MLTRERALYWLERRDRQQEYYMPDREERFAVVADVVEELAGRPDPLIVDLGIGPGSLAVRLLERISTATVVGVDARSARGFAHTVTDGPTVHDYQVARRTAANVAARPHVGRWYPAPVVGGGDRPSSVAGPEEPTVRLV